VPDDRRQDSDALNALVQECADQWQEHGSDVLERLCTQHPHLASALRRRVGLLATAGLLDEVEHAVPQRLGEFRLLDQLGSGGMGVVYRAVQRSLHREVALKVIRPDHSFFADSRQRFLREVSASARLQHPGIVPVHVVGEERGVLYYAMELVRGCSLAQVLAHLQGRDPATLTGTDLTDTVARLTAAAAGHDPPADPPALGSTWVESCLRLAQQVAEALEHAHGRGVLHRDVKPSNVMLTRQGRAMLVDFGLASTSEDPRITRSGTELGSLAYMAPEQVRGDLASIAVTTDVYGVGVLLYEMLTLTQPFACGSSEATRQAVLAGSPVPPRAKNRALAPDAALVCQTAMDPDAARRYPSARLLAHDLANVLELRPIDARPVGTWLRLRRAAQRRPARALSIGFSAVLLLGVFPALYLQQRAAGHQLLAEKKKTEEALADAQRSLQRARAEEQRARWSLGKAREAVDHFLADIGQFRAVDIPMLEELRRDTLQQAATLYEQLQLDPEGATDPALSREHALSLLSLAQVLRELDRYTEAEPVLRRVIDALTGPAAPHDDETARLLAAARTNLGATLISLERPAEAEAPLAEASASTRRLLQTMPTTELKTMLLRTALHLSSLRRDQNRTDEAAALLEEAIRLGKDLEPKIEVLRVLADAHSQLAVLCSRTSRIADAQVRYQETIALRRDIAARAPGSARFRRELAADLERLGLLLQSWRQNHAEEALRHFEEAAALQADLLRDFPRQFAYRVGYCRSRLMCAKLHERLDRDQDAESDLLDAIRNLEQVRAEMPNESSWRAPLGFALYTLADHYRARERGAEAAALLDRASDLIRGLLAETPNDYDLLQQLAELGVARGAWRLVDDAEGLRQAQDAFAVGLRFLRERPDDSHLRGTAFRCFEHLAKLLLARGDPTAILAAADTYRDANPYKWLSQLTLARTYLLCEPLLPPGDEAGKARCRADARRAVLRAGEHQLKAVLRIESDADFAPLRDDPAIVELLARAHGAGG